MSEARIRGASPGSPRRAVDALRALGGLRGEIELYTYPGDMGEEEAREAGFDPKILGTIGPGKTTPEDTVRAARDLRRLGVDLLLFVGGDGTARDIYRAVGHEITVVGVPAGVKMHSAVFAVTPRDAGEVAAAALKAKRPRVTEAEVMDIDEASFRKGVVAAKLYGYLRIPEERRSIQGVKSGRVQTGKQALQGIAREVLENMEEGCLYVFGPGTTTRDIVAHLGLKKTLLGVDVVLDRRMIATDVDERRLTELVAGTRRAKIVVTVIGGQGYVFGRGNQQLSPEIIRRVGRENVIIVASKEKLASLGGRPLLVDTGDESLDRLLAGYVRVITGSGEYAMYRLGN